MSDVQERIDSIVKGGRVVLFMKGTAQFPQCGFSGRAIQVLKACGVTEINTVNVLEDADIRQGIKDYANWPTIPQLYVAGEFVGGSDRGVRRFRRILCLWVGLAPSSRDAREECCGTPLYVRVAGVLRSVPQSARPS